MTNFSSHIKRIEELLTLLDTPNAAINDGDQRRAAITFAFAPLRQCISKFLQREIESIKNEVAGKNGEKSHHWKAVLETTRAYSMEERIFQSIGDECGDRLKKYRDEIVSKYSVSKEDALDVVLSFPIVNDEMLDLFNMQYQSTSAGAGFRDRVMELLKMEHDPTKSLAVPEREKTAPRQPQWELINGNMVLMKNGHVKCGICGARYIKPDAKNNKAKNENWPRFVFWNRGVRVKCADCEGEIVNIIPDVTEESKRSHYFNPWAQYKVDGVNRNRLGKELEPVEKCTCNAAFGALHDSNCPWQYVLELPAIVEGHCNHGIARKDDVTWSAENAFDTLVLDVPFQLYQLFGPNADLKESSKAKWTKDPTNLPANETALLHIVAGLTHNPLIRRVADAVRLRDRNRWGHDTFSESQHRCAIALIETLIQLLCDEFGLNQEVIDFKKDVRRWLNLGDVTHALADKKLVDELKASLQTLVVMLPYESIELRLNALENEVSQAVGELDVRVTDVEKDVANIKSATEQQSEYRKRFSRSIGIPSVPKDLLPRKKAFDTICGIVQSNRVCVIAGDAGLGKTIMGRMIGEKYRNESEFDVCYLTLGNEPDIVQLQKVLLGYLQGESASDDDQDRLRTQLESMLRDDHLVILDNVWKIDGPINLGFKSRAKFLITSRKRTICAEEGDAEIHDLDYLERSESESLMRDLAGPSASKKWDDDTCSWLLNFCGDLAIAVTHIGRLVCGKTKGRLKSQSAPWSWVKRQLEQSGIGALKSPLEDRLDSMLKLTLDALEDVKDRFLDLAMFPEGELIRISLVKKWWYGRFPESEENYEDWLQLFDDYSLIRLDIDASFRIHDLVVKFIKTEVNDETMCGLISSWVLDNDGEGTTYYHTELVRSFDSKLLISKSFIEKLIEELRRPLRIMPFFQLCGIVSALGPDIGKNEAIVDLLLESVLTLTLRFQLWSSAADSLGHIAPGMPDAYRNKVFISLLEFHESNAGKLSLAASDIVGALSRLKPFDSTLKQRFRKILWDTFNSNMGFVVEWNEEVVEMVFPEIIKGIEAEETRNETMRKLATIANGFPNDYKQKLLRILIKLLNGNDSVVNGIVICVLAELKLETVEYDVLLELKSNNDGVWYFLALAILSSAYLNDSKGKNIIKLLTSMPNDAEVQKCVLDILVYDSNIDKLIKEIDGLANKVVDSLILQLPSFSELSLISFGYLLCGLLDLLGHEKCQEIANDILELYFKASHDRYGLFRVLSQLAAYLPSKTIREVLLNYVTSPIESGLNTYIQSYMKCLEGEERINLMGELELIITNRKDRKDSENHAVNEVNWMVKHEESCKVIAILSVFGAGLKSRPSLGDAIWHSAMDSNVFGISFCSSEVEENMNNIALFCPAPVEIVERLLQLSNIGGLGVVLTGDLAEGLRSRIIGQLKSFVNHPSDLIRDDAIRILSRFGTGIY